MNLTSEKRIEILSKFLNVSQEDVFCVGSYSYVEYSESEREYKVKGIKEENFMVMSDHELLMYIKNRISDNNRLPFTTYKWEEALDALGVEKEEILDFYIPHILIGTVSKKELTGYDVDGSVLLLYLEGTKSEDVFAEGMARILIEQSEFWFLLSYKEYKRFGEYNIFTLYNSDFSFDEKEQFI